MLALLFIIIGLIIYFKKPKWVIFYWLTIMIFCLPPYAIISHATTPIELSSLNNNLATITRNYFAILIAFEIFKGKRMPQLPKIYTSIILFTVYLFFWSAITHFSFHVIWSGVSELLSLILPLIYILITKEKLPSNPQILLYLKGTIIVELIIIGLNIFDIYLFPSMYMTQFVENYLGEIALLDDTKITGTFSRFNALGNFLTTIVLLMSVHYFSSNNIKLKKYVAILIILIIPIALTGAKMSLVISFLILLICCLTYYRSHKLFAIATITGSILLFTFIKSINTINLQIDNAGIERQIEGLSKFFNETDSDESSTAGISIYLLDKYFDKSPLIGCGYSYKGEFAYGTWGIVTLTNFRSDARLAYILVEYGIIGFSIYMLFFSSIFSFLSKNVSIKYRRNFWIGFIYYLVLTITEAGFFDRLCFPLIFVYFIYCKREENTYQTNLIEKDKSY